MFDIRKEMTGKLEQLYIDQAKIEKQLSGSFNIEDFRKLNIINHRIEVATSRLKGEWLRGNFPQIAELSKQK